jgi:ribulose kinase
VVVGPEGVALPVGEQGEEDIIMWMDHRAGEQADAINATKHEVLESVGGAVSLEMQLPKLLWLKSHQPEVGRGSLAQAAQVWRRAGAFYDLPDWLVHRATGSAARSLCSLVCKWNYRAGPGREGAWDWAFLRQAGLGDLSEEQLGGLALPPGASVGQGLSPGGARDLGLEPGTAVGASLIDAHAGALGLLASPGPGDGGLPGRLGLVCGTSTCHMWVPPLLPAAGCWPPTPSWCPGSGDPSTPPSTRASGGGGLPSWSYIRQLPVDKRENVTTAEIFNS